jgi:hypothetical protein
MSSTRDSKSKVYPYEELLSATNGFSISNLVGQGGFSKGKDAMTKKSKCSCLVRFPQPLGQHMSDVRRIICLDPKLCSLAILS